LDSAQVVVAVANIIANSIESYADAMGPVEITAEPAGEELRLQINDLGCGMDEATVRKATSPFLSAKPMGRHHRPSRGSRLRLMSSTSRFSFSTTAAATGVIAARGILRKAI
jgi:signal transduction histidine kinase